MTAKELEFKANRLPYDPTVSDDDVAPQLNYIHLILKYRWWLGAAALVGLVVGQLAYWRAGPEYEAIGTVMVSRNNGVPLKEERTLSDWGERSEHIALITSPLIVSDAVARGQLKELKTLKGEHDVVETILEGVKAKRSAGQDRSYLNVLNITYASASAADAHRVVVAMIEAYSAYLEQTRQEKTSEVQASVKKSLDDLIAQLRRAEDDYHAFRDSAPLQWRAPVGASSPDGQVVTTNAHQERVTAIEEARRLGLLRRTELQSRIQSLERAEAEGTSRNGLEMLIRRYISADGANAAESAVSLQEVTSFENRLLPLLLEEKKLTRDYGPDHPEVISARKGIAEVLDFYRKHGIRMPDDVTPGLDGKPYRKETIDLVATYKESLGQQIKELLNRDYQLGLVFEEESTKAKEFARYQSKDQEMNAEVQRLQVLRDQLIDKLSQLSVEKDASGYGLKQIAPVREELVVKRFLKFLGGGAFAAMGLVGLICALKELRDNKLKTVLDVRQMISHPILGTVRIFDGPKPTDNPRIPHTALRYLAAPASPEAENYRSVRTALMVASEARGTKVIEISSPEPGDGKTTMIANLAIATAQSGRRVLLIDADLRRPTVHRLFGLRQEFGLSDILTGDLHLHTATKATIVEGLSIVTAGECPTNPAEALTQERFAALIKEARDEYDFVFVDAPPLLAVSDPCIIARHTDAMLLTVRLGKNRRPAIRRTVELIEAHSINVLGVVANAVPRHGQDGYGYYDYSSYTKTSNEGPTPMTAPPLRDPVFS